MRTSHALIALALLAGCAREDVAYPSLARRATEGRGFDEPAAPASAAPAVDPALDARIGDLGKRLDAAVAAFDAAAAQAERAIAAPGARTVGADGWVAAQQALGVLDDRRAQASALATEADGVARERAETVGAPYTALDALAARAQAEAERESARIADLTAKVPQP